MTSSYIIITMWFATFMNGVRSAEAPDVFAYGVTKGGRYVCSRNAVNYYSFDTLVNTGWQLKVEDLPIDSIPVHVYTVGQ